MDKIAKAALLMCGVMWSALSCVVAASLIQDTAYDMKDAAEKRRKEKYARLE